MNIFEKVLWAVDLEKDVNPTIKIIGKRNKEFGNSMIILHVLPKELENSSFKDKVQKTVKNELEEIKAKLLEYNDNEITTKIVFGNAVDSIIDISIKENVNSIIINTGDVDNDDKDKLGLNAHKVIRFSKKPVLILSDSKPKNKNLVVCSVDFSEPSAIALKDAILHAKKTNARLEVISVFEPIEVASRRLVRLGFNAGEENNQNYEAYKSEFKEFLKGFNFLDVNYEPVLLAGDPHKEIVDYAKKAAILFIGSSGKSGLQRIFMGSVAEEVANALPCSVVYIKSEELFKLKIPSNISDLETFFAQGNKLSDLGFYDEAIEQYKQCLNINEMHLPSVVALSRLYKKQNNEGLATYYDNLYKSIQVQLNNWKIEEEIRRKTNLK